MLNLLLVAFSILMVLNVIMLVRHFLMMRILNITLTALIQAQNEFNDLVDDERRKTTIAP